MEDRSSKTIDETVGLLGNGKVSKVTGLSGSAAPYLVTKTSIERGVSALYITHSRRFEEVSRDFEFYTQNLLDGPTFLPFPPWDFDPYDRLSPQIETTIRRIATLKAMAQGEKTYITSAPINSLMSRLIPKNIIEDVTLPLKVGEEKERDFILEFLLKTGYTQTSIVSVPGNFSMRGGIIDFFGTDAPFPVRAEFIGDEIDSLRTFDPETQRSIEEIETTIILPVSELILSEENLKRGIRWIRQFGAENGTPIKRIREIIGELGETRIPPGIEAGASVFYGEMSTIFDYIGKDTLVFIEEPEIAYKEAISFFTMAGDNHKRAIKRKDPTLAPEDIFLTPDEFRELVTKKGGIELNPTITGKDTDTMGVETGDHKGLRAKIKGIGKGESMLAPLARELMVGLESAKRVAFVCLTRTQGNRMRELLSSYGVDLVISEDPFFGYLSGKRAGAILIGGLGEGFEDPSSGISVITEEEIFGAKVKVRRPRGHIEKQARRKDLGEIVTSTDPLSPGDFVVHSRFGIGKYIGLVNLKVMELIGDFVHLEYDEGDRLYIPIDRLSLIHRYNGINGAEPNLDKLGSKKWERSKQKIKSDILEMAGELAKLYASRKALPGNKYETPGRDFGEFEASFAFEETPDQLLAVQDIVADMTNTTPMDRLIAGDVGYGKTEVAMRAAYIAAMEGKQVAIVVPTTILAEQHYNTFTERFKDYPIKVKMLSRFLKPKEQREVVKGIKDATVDIVIGTHRLLSKDIDFPNIGLLIIDEEHRFGVAHKEKLVKMKTQVDVLTLTATPIPRTLSMSIMGIRDISIINTAPPNRLSVKTYVSEFDTDVIKEAITREISRGGQVFFVHNRVRTIMAIRELLENLMVGIRLGVAHGQMNAEELERVMLDFVDRKIDVLISTAIIESGLDIPSANTIIINRADTFGLAQLYQMRGRVGRSSMRAYAYLMVPDSTSMTADARKRLRVIQEFSALGSGIKVATYDLEIRGAGNLLGKHQSGNINTLGFDMYQKLVEEAIREIKGEPEIVEINPEIKLPIEAFIPEEYISDSNLRLYLYRKFVNARNEGSLMETEEEIADRFGPLPLEVDRLIDVMKLRLLAQRAKITDLNYKNGTVNMTFHEKAKIDTEQIVSMVSREPQQFQLSPNRLLKYRHPSLISSSHNSQEGERLIISLKNVLQRISQYVSF